MGIETISSAGCFLILVLVLVAVFIFHSLFQPLRSWMDYMLPLLAIGKLCLIFVVLLVFLRFRLPLWLTIFGGALTAGLMGRSSLGDLAAVPVHVLGQQDFLVLCVMVSMLLALAGIQQASGQSQKLVQGMEGHIKNSNLRLVLFPALVGLLPMPGGALFSCPMIRDTARNMNLDNSQKALINYWFRHVWEVAWPLYPGYALACVLLGIPLTRLWLFTFPAVFLAIFIGWFFFLRRLKVVLPHTAPEDENTRGETASGATPAVAAEADTQAEIQPLGTVLLHGLPIAVTLAGAVVLGTLFDFFWPALPTQLAFCGSLVLAISIAIYQGRGCCNKPLAGIVFNHNMVRILLMLFAIYVFKQVITESGIVADLANLGADTFFACLAFIIIPFISGALTGIFVGAVGLSLPLVLGMLDHPVLQEYTVPLVVMAILSSNCGQMLSPVHVCLVVTCEFFKSTMGQLLKALVKPIACAFVGAVCWVCVLVLFNPSF